MTDEGKRRGIKRMFGYIGMTKPPYPENHPGAIKFHAECERRNVQVLIASERISVPRASISPLGGDQCVVWFASDGNPDKAECWGAIDPVEAISRIPKGAEIYIREPPYSSKTYAYETAKARALALLQDSVDPECPVKEIRSGTELSNLPELPW
jgi:hypothetical protein